MATLMDLIAGYSQGGAPVDDSSQSLGQAARDLYQGLINPKAWQEVKQATQRTTNIAPAVLESLARGSIAQVPGTIGDTSSLLRQLAPQTMQQIFGNRTAPTTEEILGYVPRATPAYQGSQEHEMVGGLLSPAMGYFAKALPLATKDMPIGMMLAPSKYVGTPLEGLPNVVNVGGKLEEFGTDQRLVDIAKDYVSNKGFVYVPQKKYAELDPERAKKLAEAYQKMENNPNNPKVKKSYNALIEETMAQYEALRKKGYKFDFMPESGDVYGNPRNAINDIVLNKHLSVYPTEQGFGGPSALKASETNPLLMRIGEKWNGKDVTANDVFRAVHDVFGHAKHGVGFRAGGEENAFQAHARMYSPEALPAVTSETRGQNSWVNFGPYGQINRSANPLLTEYAEQKAGLLPSWSWMEGLLK